MVTTAQTSSLDHGMMGDVWGKDQKERWQIAHGDQRAAT